MNTLKLILAKLEGATTPEKILVVTVDKETALAVKEAHGVPVVTWKAKGYHAPIDFLLLYDSICPAGGIPEIYNNLRSNDGVLIMWDEL